MKNTEETPDGSKNSPVCTLCKTLNRPSHKCCLQRLWKHVESVARMESTVAAAASSRPKTSTPAATRMLPVKSHPSNLTSRDGIKQPSTWMVELAHIKDESAENAFQSWEHMKLRGRVMAKEVMVLIDSGCTHNFISSKVVKALNLKPTALDPYVVHLPDGSNQLWNRQVKSVPLRIQTYYDLLTFGIMDLAHIDIILGQQWLYAKDPKISFRKHTVELDHNGKRHKLMGEKNLPDTALG
jgi:hypothetical protein